MLAFVFAAVAVQAAAVQPEAFSIPSTDGHVINGQVDAPDGEPQGVVILVAGTGAFDRDVRFGRSGTSSSSTTRRRRPSRPRALAPTSARSTPGPVRPRV